MRVFNTFRKTQTAISIYHTNTYVMIRLEAGSD